MVVTFRLSGGWQVEAYTREILGSSCQIAKITDHEIISPFQTHTQSYPRALCDQDLRIPPSHEAGHVI